MPVDDTYPSRAAATTVTIVALSDFQCPFCARLEPILEEVHAAYGDTVRVVWKDFPLTSIHPDAFKAAEASHCAAEQRRYWQYHRRLFANQEQMGAGELMAHAAALGLDVGRFSACLSHRGTRRACRRASTPVAGWACRRRRRSSSTAGSCTGRSRSACSRSSSRRSCTAEQTTEAAREDDGSSSAA